LIKYKSLHTSILYQIEYNITQKITWPKKRLPGFQTFPVSKAPRVDKLKFIFNTTEQHQLAQTDVALLFKNQQPVKKDHPLQVRHTDPFINAMKSFCIFDCGKIQHCIAETPEIS
jgi:hypothetical protein